MNFIMRDTIIVIEAAILRLFIVLITLPFPFLEWLFNLLLHRTQWVLMWLIRMERWTAAVIEDHLR